MALSLHWPITPPEYWISNIDYSQQRVCSSSHTKTCINRGCRSANANPPWKTITAEHRKLENTGAGVGGQNKAKQLSLSSAADSAWLHVKKTARKREWKERLEKRRYSLHVLFINAAQSKIQKCGSTQVFTGYVKQQWTLKACLAGLHTMYQSSQTEHSSFTSFFHMLVLTSAKQRHSAKADFFCPAWKLAPLHCFQASFFVPRWTLLQYEKSEVWAMERAEAQY